ncbi:antifreeze glycopeptide AFGP poly protein [Leucosporidium creatinivorum]|uniref:Antifreeze glycopeptide AFGP poly protein n=1 Tax=Leucosporidium creatinivorum TaxID=106004 RepID=A0A1Y2ERV4_9BASI|nr:antifreeze glycopeptide AFGP poly protein [Leucosporidium creatinivorum]
MRSLVALFALIPALAVAQNGYGRFPCGTFTPDQSLCAAAEGQDGTNGPGVLTGLVCVQQPETLAYFCGIAGAPCQTADQCDFGACVNGACSAGLGGACASDDFNCLGSLTCNGVDDPTGTADNTCGGTGAFCAPESLGSPDLTDAENEALFNELCVSGYCNFGTGFCEARHGLEGEDCSSDPQFFCGSGLFCVNNICSATAPSQRARSRRNSVPNTRRSLCPASQEACPLLSGKRGAGYECIDTQNNLESCGGCHSAGGVDCTSLPGVEAVACVSGSCQVMGCERGYSWDAPGNACVRVEVL